MVWVILAAACLALLRGIAGHCETVLSAHPHAHPHNQFLAQEGDADFLAGLLTAPLRHIRMLRG